jgi:hypothetical protein
VTVDSGEKESSRRGTQHVFEEAQVNVFLGLDAQKAIQLLGLAGERMLSGARSGRGFAQLSGRRIGKTQHCLVEVLVELLTVRHNRQVVALLAGGRGEMEMAIASEDRSRNLAVYFAVKGNAAAAKGENTRIALEFEILYGDDFTAGQQSAQLHVMRIGIAGTLCLQVSKAADQKTQNGETDDTKTRHRWRVPVF